MLLWLGVSVFLSLVRVLAYHLELSVWHSGSDPLIHSLGCFHELDSGESGPLLCAMLQRGAGMKWTCGQTLRWPIKSYILCDGIPVSCLSAVL